LPRTKGTGEGLKEKKPKRKGIGGGKGSQSKLGAYVRYLRRDYVPRDGVSFGGEEVGGGKKREGKIRRGREICQMYCSGDERREKNTTAKGENIEAGEIGLLNY